MSLLLYYVIKICSNFLFIFIHHQYFDRIFMWSSFNCTLYVDFRVWYFVQMIFNIFISSTQCPQTGHSLAILCVY